MLYPSIEDHYLRAHPAAHHRNSSCSRWNSDQWEVAVIPSNLPASAPDQQTLRLLCRECGVVELHQHNGEPDSRRVTTTELIGYGTRPARECGLYLHAGPTLGSLRLAADRGPQTYYVTRTADVPAVAADVLGVVAYWVTPRGVVRWQTGLQLHRGEFAFMIRESGPKDLRSRRAAVRWIAERLDQAAADAAAGAR